MKRHLFIWFVVMVLGIAWLWTIFAIPEICHNAGRAQSQKKPERYLRMPVYRM